MIAIRRVEQPLTLAVLDQIAKEVPALYVTFARPNIEDSVRNVFSEPEDGEILVIVDFDSAAELRRKFGAATGESMLGFAAYAFTGLANSAEGYASVVQDTRDWRHRQAPLGPAAT